MKTFTTFAALLILLSTGHPTADAALRTVALSGNTAPGTSDNFTILFSPSLNNAGQTAFFGILNSSSATDRGIWSEGGGSGLALVAREGNTAPGTSDNFTFLDNNLVLNNAGQTAFLGRLDSSLSTNSGIWSEGGGSGLALVAREGNTAPGTSDNFTGLAFPVLNNAGQTAFTARLNSSSVTSTGIWSEGGGSGLALVAREGNTAPGTSDNFASFGNDVGSVLNNAGQTAFLGFLNNSSSATDHGIWAEDSLGVLTLIARKGDLLDVDDGPGTDFRTIKFLDFSTNTGNVDDWASGFNDLGELAFLASFTDGTQGVFISDLVAIPEPTSLVLGALVCHQA